MCRVKHDICEHSQLYLALSPTGCIITLRTTVVVLYLLRLIHVRIVAQNYKSTSHGPDPGPDLVCSGPNLCQTQVRPRPDPGQTWTVNLQCWEANLTQVSLLKVRSVQENSRNYLFKHLIFSAKTSCQTFSKLLVNRGSFGILTWFKYLVIHQMTNSNLTASLNKDMPSYPYQALPAPSRANDYFEVLSCWL